MSHIPIDELLTLLTEAIDPRLLEIGRRRQKAVWQGDTPDYAPLLLGYSQPFTAGLERLDRRYKLAEHHLIGGPPCRELEQFPHYNLVQQYENPEKMLYESLWEMLGWARGHSDAQLSVRADVGAFIYPALGLELNIDTQEAPSVSTNLTKKQIAELDVNHVLEHRSIGKIISFIEYFRDHLPAGVHQFLPALGGPLTLAERIRGNEIWTDFYDDPEFARQLLQKCSIVYKNLIKLFRKAVNFPESCTYDGPLYIVGSCAKMPDDNIVLISSQMHRDFIVPVINLCLESFDNAWYHSCGYYPEQLENILAIEKFHAINLGNPELWDMDETVARIVRAGKIYYGAWPAKHGESLKDCLRRAVVANGPGRNGMIIFLQSEGSFPPPDEIMNIWHQLQDKP